MTSIVFIGAGRLGNTLAAALACAADLVFLTVPDDAIAGSVAGPVSRGDAGVIERHLLALERLGREHAMFYRELTRRQIELARASGRLDDTQLARLRRAIAD